MRKQFIETNRDVLLEYLMEGNSKEDLALLFLRSRNIRQLQTIFNEAVEWTNDLVDEDDNE